MAIDVNRRFIAEFEHHHGTIAMYPFRTDIWRSDAVYMQEYVINLVKCIAKYENVYLICRNQDVEKLQGELNNSIFLHNIRVIPLEYDDIWARDIGPSFVRIAEELIAINWRFNAWGGLKEGSYFPWDKDNAFAVEFSKYLNINTIDADIVLEGGAILTDGEGTLFTTRSVLLNRNRNPFKSKEYIENVLQNCLGVRKVIWLKQGLADDETNGHIDNVMSIIRPHEVCIAWTDDKKNPNYARVREILKTIQKSYECEVHKIPLPTPLYMSAEEEAGLITNDDAIIRKEGDLLPASYLNFYMVNGGVLIPKFGCVEDEQVLEIFKRVFPDRMIEQIYSREPLLGGGGIHCILHEIPDLR